MQPKPQSKSHSLSKVSKPPQLCTIFKPNELIKAKKFNMNFIEKRIYYAILDNNHVSTPDQTVYTIPYEMVLNPNDVATGNRKINAKRISDALQKRVFYFDASFMQKQFGDDTEASMNPFPEINTYDDHFKVHLWHRFKKILTLVGAGLGFTKGDRETLRSFNHEISDEFYWLIRQRQAWGQTWEVELSELKEMIGLSDRYDLYQNFKKKVLDAAKEDCKGTWVEFDYKPIKKGKGGAVYAIIFFFKNGPKQEKDVPAGEDYTWERTLMQYNVDPIKVKEIRSRVKVSQESEKGFIWDSDYIRFCLEKLVSELKEIKKDKKRKQIQNTGAWMYTMLTNPTQEFLDYVSAKKEMISSEVQQKLELNFEPKGGSALSKKNQQAIKESREALEILTVEAELEWKNFHAMGHEKHLTFEAYMNKHGFYVQQGKWVR